MLLSTQIINAIVYVQNQNNLFMARLPVDYVKYRNFSYFPGVEIFMAIRLKLCRNCAFQQNFRTRKLGEI